MKQQPLIETRRKCVDRPCYFILKKAGIRFNKKEGYVYADDVNLLIRLLKCNGMCRVCTHEFTPLQRETLVDRFVEAFFAEFRL